MITLQIVEQPESDLFRELKRAMRSHDLRTFSTQNKGKRITHMTYPGHINWSHDGSVITCVVKNPKNPNTEWQLMHAFLGRLADRYAAYIHSINIQFPDAEWED
jgi:hypothetical protein